MKGESVFEDEQGERSEDLVYYSVAEEAVVVVSLAEDGRLNAILSLVRTVFISVVLGVGSVVFSKGV